MHTLNLGIFAHVDAGKTTLTERLLYAAGVIDEVGSVDAGTTQTDSLPLEQRRGITIKSAVASFSIGDTSVNLIDTPGHPDFIAEVDRALVVLDGAVLVISAVEGVQPQTRILMRALQRLRVPTLLFVNKIDRAGARHQELLHTISERLTPAVIEMGSTHELGTPAANFTSWCSADAAFTERLAAVLAERNDDILGAYVRDASMLSYDRLRAELVAQTRRALVHPVFFGSAMTGAGVGVLMAGIAELLPTATGDRDGPLSGRVFKIERTRTGERTTYVRMRTGTLRARDRVKSARGVTETVTGVSVFEPGGTVQRPSVVAGQIARVSGLRDVQIGDWIGRPRHKRTDRQFSPPTMESVVVAVRHEDRAPLRVALRQLAEQDPLINVRQDDELDELSVSLYGEVQKEVIGATLADDFGIDVIFRETTTIYIERPVGTGSALALLTDDANRYSATIGLRVDPAPAGSGIAFRLDIDTRLIPVHIYKTVDGFSQRMDQYVERTLQEGLYGWQVADCVVTMTDCDYYVGDGPRKPTRPTEKTTAVHFRKLTPIVLRRALEQARTVVCDPNMRVHIETPASTVGAVVAATTRRGGTLEPLSVRGDLATVEAIVSAARVQDLQRALSSVTGGDAAVETSFAGYAPISGSAPIRHRRATARSETRRRGA
jgi:ribosomal protection tetracycline resistance protein